MLFQNFFNDDFSFSPFLTLYNSMEVVPNVSDAKILTNLKFPMKPLEFNKFNNLGSYK